MWNWQQKEWPRFSYEADRLKPFEDNFLQASGFLKGTMTYLKQEDTLRLTIELMSEEAMKSSEIEGDYLNRESIQSSLRRNFGLETDHRKIPPAERGISDLLTDIYQTISQPLTHESLFKWHRFLSNARYDLESIGNYRTHADPMQVVSGPIGRPKVYFEAPPSRDVPKEMDAFISWFNKTAPGGSDPLPALTRAGLAHLYFVCIHPFEDGNGRIGRALAEKILLQHHKSKPLLALSRTIQKHKKGYYTALEQNNQFLEVTSWLVYFSETVLAAMNDTRMLITFIIQKAKIFDKLKDKLNPRQEKVISRLFEAGHEGFKGGLSANNYISITKTSSATATRDLQNLVEIGILRRTGDLKGTRYHLNINFAEPNQNNLCL